MDKNRFTRFQGMVVFLAGCPTLAVAIQLEIEFAEKAGVQHFGALTASRTVKRGTANRLE